MLSHVSVVIPTYKRSAYLREAIDSVIAQNYQGLDIIVVDDNANYPTYRQETQALIQKYDNAPITVRAVYPERNLGGALARNLGVSVSEADYIAFLDDDDYFLSDKISHCMEALTDNRLDFVYHFVCDSENRLYARRYDYPIVDLFVHGGLFATSQLVVNRERFLLIGGFDDTPAKQDAILTFKLLHAGYQMGVVPEVLGYYRNHANERISNRQKTFEGEVNLFQKYHMIKEQLSTEERRLIETHSYIRLIKQSLKMKQIKNVLYYGFQGISHHRCYFLQRLWLAFYQSLRG